MSAGVYLGVLLALVWALRSRLPWTRVGGGVLAASLVGLVAWLARDPAVRQRLADPDRWPVLVFVALALFLAWWTLRREQVRETPIHEAADVESLSRFVPRPWWPTLGLLAVFLAAAFVPTPLGDAAVPLRDVAPTVASTPWFLSGLAFLAGLVGPFLAWIVVPVATAAALWATPFLDTSHPETEGPFSGRRDEAPFFLWAWIGLGVVPLACAAFAGPPSAAPAATAIGVPLAEAVWIDLLGTGEPSAWVLRELPGLAILAAIFVVLPLYLPRWKATRGVFARHLRRLGRRRYVCLVALLGCFALVPVGLAFHTLGLNPWLRLPFAGGWL